MRVKRTSPARVVARAAALLGAGAVVALCACGFAGVSTREGDPAGANPGAGAETGPSDAMASDALAALDGPAVDAGDAVDAKDARGGGAFACQGIQDCLGVGVCCGSLSGGGAGSECRATCASGEVQVCDPAAAVSGCGVDTCSAQNASDWGAPQGTGTCGGRCPGGC
jgi:hypothetical protein